MPIDQDVEGALRSVPNVGEERGVFIGHRRADRRSAS
jgi:hypothetical protein